MAIGKMDFTAMRLRYSNICREIRAFAVLVYLYPGSRFLHFRCIPHTEWTDVGKYKWPVNLRDDVGIVGELRRHDPNYRNGDYVPFRFVLFPQV